MDCSTLAFFVLHNLPEFPQTHVHWINDAIQSTHPLWPSSPAFNLSPNQGLYQWIGSSHPVAKHWSLSSSINPSDEYLGLISFRIDWFELLAVQGDSHQSSPVLQLESINSSALSLLYGSTLTFIHDYGKNYSFDYMDFVGKCLCFLICCLGLSMENEMATHSSVLAWRIPWTEKPGGLQSMGSHRVGHDWSNLAAAGLSKLFFQGASICLNPLHLTSECFYGEKY